MPELPELEALAQAIDPLVARAEIGSPIFVHFAVGKTHDPPFSGLTGRRVLTDMFDPDRPGEVHVSLASRTDLLLVVPATDVFEAIMVTAQRLESSRVVCGLSNKLTADEQAKLTGDAWERLPEPRPRLNLEVCAPDGTIREFALGPHAPRMRPQDVELMHQLWLNITADPKFAGAHHYHIVALALEELQRELSTEQRAQLLQKLQDEMQAPPRTDLNS